MILITGNNGYIGPVMTRLLHEHGHTVRGIDSQYFHGCDLFPPTNVPDQQIIKDMRDIAYTDLEGISAIIHLAGLSNDPLGEINHTLTHDINMTASVNLAEMARNIGVERFIFASSCSLYGVASNDKPLTEDGVLNPVTAYAKAKAQVEEAVSRLATDSFHPVFMRNATVYGLSPTLRLDLVVNNLVAWAYLTGKVSIMSDGTPWRPIVHIEDFCRAFVAALEAPLGKVHNERFNVGINEENYQIKDIANEVKSIVPHCEVEILNQTGSDERTYRVDFAKIKTALSDFKPVWNVRKGIEELYHAYQDVGLTIEDFQSPKYFRVRWIRHLLENKRIDNNLRWL